MFLTRFVRMSLLGAMLAGVCLHAGSVSAKGVSNDIEAENQDVLHFHLLRPDNENPFWGLLEKSMYAACADLGCEVSATRAGWDHFKMVEQARSFIQSQEKPDIIIFQSFKNNGPMIIKALETAGIDHILVNAGLTEDQSEQMGKPRQIYKHWIGQMMPDDYSAGWLTAEALYKEAKARGYENENGEITFAGIEGNSADGASIERLKGLNDFVKKHDDFKLLQIVQGRWDGELSHKLAASLMRRYPHMKVIWSAGDTTAFGVIDATKDVEREGMLTAGVDWAARALDEVEKGRMLGTVGGHFMEGAWAVILGFDYKKGIDFAETEGVEMKSEMFYLDQETVPLYRAKFGEGNFDSIDYKSFSKFFNPEQEAYNFNIIDQLQDQ